MAAVMQLEDPLKKAMPKLGPPVQNLGGLQPNTAPIANRPVASPAVNTASPGAPPAAPVQAPVNPQIGAPVAPPVGQPPGAVVPTPAAAPVGSSSSSSSSSYGSGGGISPGTSSTLEDQLRGYITGGLGGVTSKAFIDRAKNQLGSAVEGQRAQGVRRSDDDLIRRGLGRSGMGAEQAQAIGTGAQGALSSGIADILGKAEQQDIAGRESAAGTAGNLLGMNRSWDQYQTERSDAQAARAAANRQEDTGFTYVDPDTGESFQMDENWF